MNNGMIKTNKQLVLEAVEDLHRLEQIVTRETLANHLDMKLSVIDDRLKALVADERIMRVQRGVFVPVAQHPPARQISHTELPDGTVVLDIGDEVLHLTPGKPGPWVLCWVVGHCKQPRLILAMPLHTQMPN